MLTIILLCAIPAAFLLGRWLTVKQFQKTILEYNGLIQRYLSLFESVDLYIEKLNGLVAGKQAQIEALTKLAQAQKQLLLDLHPEIESIIKKAKQSLN